VLATGEDANHTEQLLEPVVDALERGVPEPPPRTLRWLRNKQG
jgi:hypothetical protein